MNRADKIINTVVVLIVIVITITAICLKYNWRFLW